MLGALGQFFDTYVFGHDRAALLATPLPASDADHAEASAQQAARLRTELARIDAAERGLISELEQPADPGDPAAGLPRPHPRTLRRALRPAHRHRNQAHRPGSRHPGRQRPRPARRLARRRRDPGAKRPPGSRKPCSPRSRSRPSTTTTNQVTIRATLTTDTPRTIAALLADPRTDDDSPAKPATSQDAMSHLGSAPIGMVTVHGHCRPAIAACSRRPFFRSRSPRAPKITHVTL